MNFDIIQTRSGDVHIVQNDPNKYSRRSIIGQASTYEEAVQLRDAHRSKIEQRKSKLADAWNNSFDKAMENGNMQEINRLCGITY